MNKVILVFVGLFLISHLTFAASSEVVVENTVGASKEQSKTKAKKDILQQTIEQVSMKYIKDYIGEEKAESSRRLINNKIIKKSGRYILTINNGSIQKAAEGGYEMPIQLKVSLSSLRKMLLKEGLLYQLKGVPSVLPVFRVEDHVNSVSYSWWAHPLTQGRVFVAQQEKSLSQQLKRQLWTHGFFGLTPTKWRLGEAVPKLLKEDDLSKESILFLGQYFSSSIVTRGYIQYLPIKNSPNVYRINVKLQALHSGNGRIVGEVIRSYETDPGLFRHVVNKQLGEVSERLAKDLSAQILEAWKKGTFGAELFKLTLKGEIKHQDLQKFKKQILVRVKEIKSLKERLFEPRQVTFEVDSSTNPQKLAKILSNKKFNGMKVRVLDVGIGGLAISVNLL